MKKTLLLLVISLSSVAAWSQTPSVAEVENIIPNPGFEKYSGTPIGWFYKGQHFTKVVKYWSSATGASPDVFGPKVRVPSHWAAKGFGKQKARTGDCMAGITVYGCEDGKPHCREYLQIQLREPLVKGQNYYAEFYVSHLPLSMQVNNIGMYFSKEKFDLVTDDPIETTPQIKAENILAASYGQWVKVAGRFTAKSEAEFLLIGNFFPDSLTNVRRNNPNSLKYGYYYIDDILLKKEQPILEIPLKEDDLSLIKVEPGKIIQLKNIFFDTDKTELLPRSHVELRKLHLLMKENPTMVIQVNGHTDTDGDDDYNIELSTRRAKAVVDYLIANGIEPRRALYKGFGNTRPIGDNKTVAGKQLNRRVEFLILQK